MQNDVIKAEPLFTAFLVEHNISLAAANHVGPLLRKMFLKNEIAKQYGWAHTKIEEILKSMKNGPFAAVCDGSNDSDFKLFPVVVTYFDFSKDSIWNSLLSIPKLTGDSTGENISKLIVGTLKI